jgi:DNA-binding MarR family transcriptional regulator
MSRGVAERTELLACLVGELRQLSAATIMFHQVVADRLGLNGTDHKCVDILERAGPMTAGELAQHTGLTTGAVTGVIDRLEKAGFVRRAEDADDRRRVIIEPIRSRIEKVVAPLFASMGRAAAELSARYSTEQLALICEFARRAHELALAEAHKLREDPVPAKAPRRAKPAKRPKPAG